MMNKKTAFTIFLVASLLLLVCSAILYIAFSYKELQPTDGYVDDIWGDAGIYLVGVIFIVALLPFFMCELTLLFGGSVLLKTNPRRIAKILIMIGTASSALLCLFFTCTTIRWIGDLGNAMSIFIDSLLFSWPTALISLLLFVIGMCLHLRKATNVERIASNELTPD